MAERPILFSGPLVRAILNGRKTETRRLVTPGTSTCSDVAGDKTTWPASPDWSKVDTATLHHIPGRYAYPRIEAADVLWVRETWQPIGGNLTEPAGVTVRYAADGRPRACVGNSDAWRADRMAKYGRHWCRVGGQHKGLWPGIHMPKWASRISLRVTEVRAERLQAIDEAGAIAEGLEAGLVGFVFQPAKSKFELLWDAINGKREGATWADNPWVWAIRFEVAEVKR